MWDCCWSRLSPDHAEVCTPNQTLTNTPFLLDPAPWQLKSKVMSFCKNCVQGMSSSHDSNSTGYHSPIPGVIHEGTPTGKDILCRLPVGISNSLSGKWEKFGGVDCYVGVPTVEYSKNKVLLFITDVFGPQLVNNQVCYADKLHFPCLTRELVI